MCIMCGCCVSECNSMEADPAFLGPAALAKGYRFVGDVRDTKTRERLEQYNGKHGVWDCTRCYFCNERCPKGVDPRDAIAKLGAAMFDHGITERQGRQARQGVHRLGQGPGRQRSAPVPARRRSTTATCPRRRSSRSRSAPEALKPSWAGMGVKLGMQGQGAAAVARRAPPPEGPRRGAQAVAHPRGRGDAPSAAAATSRSRPSPLPPNIAQGVRTQFTPEEIFERTGAVVSSDLTRGGGKEPRTKVDLATYYGDDTVVQQFVADGGLEHDHGLRPRPTNYARSRRRRSTPTAHARAPRRTRDDA